ncbi:MAG: PIG-L family deacetylase [Clostridia bacterium]|nr:PIG-L family deacetylase [Clostridia bacterium]
MTKRNVFYIVALIMVSILMAATVFGADADYSSTSVTSVGFSNPGLMNDGSERDYSASFGESSITVTRNNGISSLYVVFDRLPPVWTLTDSSTGESRTCGTYTFLHEYVDVEALFGYCPTQVELSFTEGVSVAEIYGFGEGELPKWVQIWEPALSEADLLMISSHSDDEQLFFAGVLPYYAGELGLRVQVAYVVNHFDTRMRPHEQLDGLWEVGVRNYPIIPEFPDLYSESLNGAISAFGGYGYTLDDFSEYFTETIRRTKPLVIVTHDINGEYGHGTHLLCVEALRNCLNKTSDPTYFQESASQFGVWDVEKVYLHLYGENQIVMDFDKPLEKFGGKTAFQVTQDGFRHHSSQHWTWFYKWIYGQNGNITKATEITTYSPIYYGLYRTTVGYDVVGGDFFENVKTYSVREAEALIPETEAPETVLVETDAPSETEEIPIETDSPSDDIDKNDPNLRPSDKNAVNPIIIVAVAAILMVVILIISIVMLKMPGKKRRYR